MKKASDHLPPDVHTMRLWYDRGPHSRAYQFLHWSVIEFPRDLHTGYNRPVKVWLNFLAEQHGKDPMIGIFSFHQVGALI